MFLTGLALFLVGASIAASRVLMNVLIFGRVVQGIGAAGMFTMSAIVIVDLTQPRQRAGWQAISQAFGALGNICGPLMSALLINKFRLPWVSSSSLSAVLVFLAQSADTIHRVLSSSPRPSSSQSFSSPSLFCSRATPEN